MLLKEQQKPKGFRFSFTLEQFGTRISLSVSLTPTFFLAIAPVLMAR